MLVLTGKLHTTPVPDRRKAREKKRCSLFTDPDPLWTVPHILSEVCHVRTASPDDKVLLWANVPVSTTTAHTGISWIFKRGGLCIGHGATPAVVPPCSVLYAYVHVDWHGQRKTLRAQKLQLRKRLEKVDYREARPDTPLRFVRPPFVIAQLWIRIRSPLQVQVQRSTLLSKRHLWRCSTNCFVPSLASFCRSLLWMLLE